MPIDVRDMDKMTPLIRAAEAGHGEAFHLLVESGTDLHALALCQIDVLEQAAGGGNVEIVRFLLDKGLPIEGHWKPTSKFAEREGHITPLFAATVDGRRSRPPPSRSRRQLEPSMPAIRRSSMPRAKPSWLVLRALEAERKFKAIAALLADKPSADEKAAESIDLETLAAKFAASATASAYQQVIRLLTEQCGEPTPWQPVPDHGVAAPSVYRFTFRPASPKTPKGEKSPAKRSSQKILDSLLTDVHNAGYTLVLEEPWMPGEPAKLVLFPTSDKYAVIAATGTEGSNYSIRTDDVLSWLRELDQDNPFNLRYASHEMVGGDFTGPVKAAKKLAARIAEFCPPCLDEGFETDEELAYAIAKSRSFLLRWD